MKTTTTTKVQLNDRLMAILQSIALHAVQLQHKGEVDTGPGGGGFTGVEQELREVDDLLVYYLNDE